MSSEPLLQKSNLESLSGMQALTTGTSAKHLKSAIDRALLNISVTRKFLPYGIISACPSLDNSSLYAITKGSSMLIKLSLSTFEIESKTKVSKFALVCFSLTPSQSVAVVGSADGSIHVVDLAKFETTTSIMCHKGKSVKGIVVHADGTWARVLDTNGDLRAVDLKPGGTLADAKMGGKSFLVMRKNGDYFLGGGTDITLCNIGLEVLKRYSARQSVKTVFLTDKYILASLENDICEIIDIEKGVIVNEIYVDENPTYFMLSNDEKVLFSGHANGKVACYDMEYNERYVYLEMNSRPISYMFLMPEGDRFGTLSHEIRMSTALVPKFKSYPSIKTTANSACFISASQIAYNSTDSIYIYNTETATSTRILRMRGLSKSFAFIPPSHIVTTQRRNLIFLNIENQTLIRFRDKELLITDKIVSNGNSTFIAFPTNDKSIMVFDCMDFKFASPLVGHSADINTIAFADNETLISADSHIFIWNVAAGSQTACLSGHESSITAIITHQQYLFSASEDLELLMWNWKLQILVQKMKNPHQNRIIELYVADDKLVSASSESIVFWEAKTVTTVFSIYPLIKCVQIVFSDDNSHFLYSTGTSIIIMQNPYYQTEFEVFGGQDWQVADYLQELRNAQQAANKPYKEEFTNWIVMPFQINLGHVYVTLNQEKYLNSFLLAGGSIISNLNNQNILSIAVEKSLDACTVLIISNLKKRLNTNPLAFGFLTHEILESLNNAGSESLLKLYNSIYRVSDQAGIEKFCPSSTKLPIYQHSELVELVQSDFFPPVTDEDDNGVSVEIKQALVKIDTEVGSIKSKSFIKSLVECPNSDIFQSAFVQDMLLEKWQRIRWILYLQGFIYISHVLVYAYLLLYFDDIYVPLAFLFFLNLLLTAYEVVQFFILLMEYFSDPWNYVDFARFILMNIYIIALYIGDRSEWVVYNLGGVLTILVFLRGISYFRLFESTRYMLDLIQEVISDMSGFLLILAYSVISFAFIFFALDVRGATQLSETILTAYQVNIGGGDPTGKPELYVFLFYFSTVINPIILLNLLISIMGNTFERVENASIVSNYKELANLVLEGEQVMIWKRMSHSITYLQSCNRQPEVIASEPIVRKVKKIGERITGVEERVGGVEEKVDLMLSKFDMVMEKLNSISDDIKNIPKGEEQAEEDLDL